MKRLVAAGMVLMAGAMHAQSSDVFRSVHARKDVPLTTDPRSAFWRGGAPIFADRDAQGALVPHHRTEIRSRWTATHLYLLYVCPYEELNLKPDAVLTQETNELWKWDVAEAFLGSDFKNIRRYKEFEVSPQGEWIDLDVDLALPHHEVGWTWNSGMEVAARIDRKNKVWYGAMRIPFSSLIPQVPTKGTVFRANFFRSQGPEENSRNIAWKAPMTATFHTPERFGTLKLVMKK